MSIRDGGAAGGGDGGVGIVGGGLGGLAAACTLAARGHKVTLFDKNPWLGGKAAVHEAEGFRFDMGPTILTVPRVLERVFTEAGRDMHRELELVRLDPQWRCFYEDGSVLDLREGAGEMRAELERFAPGSADGYEAFLKVSERIADVSDRFFFWKSVEDLRDTMNLRSGMTISTLRDVLSIRMQRTVSGQVKRSVKDGRVTQMLEHFIQYVGSSPLASPAVLCGIAHMQVGEGVWYPMGGTRAVPEALARLASDLGVDLRPGVDVTRITTRDGRATGVETAGGERIAFERVVSNMDSVRTYRELIGGDAARAFERTRKREAACSGVVLYLGLDRAYEHLAHHNFVFSRDPEEEFHAIYDRGEPAPDPHGLPRRALRAPSPRWRPRGARRSTSSCTRPTCARITTGLRCCPPTAAPSSTSWGARAAWRTSRSASSPSACSRPQDIHDRYRVLDGAIYGLASHGRVLGAFKPGNRSRQVANLYLAGGSAHPGPGMPMALMSGWIAADALDRDAGGQSRARAAPRQEPAVQAAE